MESRSDGFQRDSPFLQNIRPHQVPPVPFGVGLHVRLGRREASDAEPCKCVCIYMTVCVCVMKTKCYGFWFSPDWWRKKKSSSSIRLQYILKEGQRRRYNITNVSLHRIGCILFNSNSAPNMSFSPESKDKQQIYPHLRSLKQRIFISVMKTHDNKAQRPSYHNIQWCELLIISP